MEKLTKKDIVNNIAEETGFTKKEITEIVNSALNQINDAQLMDKKLTQQDSENSLLQNVLLVKESTL